MRLTDQIVKRLPAPPRGNRVSYDDQIRGFGCRVTAAGARAFVLAYRRRSDQRPRRFTIGSFPDWSTAAAREEAKRLKREVDGGADPVGDYADSRAAPTIADLCTRFLADYVPRKRATTQRVYKQQIAAEILPLLGKTKVGAITHADVDSWHHKLAARAPTHANRVLAVLSKMFSLAVRWGWRSDNPAKGVERRAEHKRNRFLSAGELTRLTAALAELPDVGAANAVRLLLLTGARRGELLAAEWTDFDLDAGVWTKPAATTKTATLHRVPLSAPACRLLVEMRKQAGDNEWLFPARGGGHRPHINGAWIALREAADLSDVRLHDLRHTYASVLASAGLSLPVIGALLGHTTANTTLRYSHLIDDVLRTATERAGAVITGQPSAEIVPLKGRRS